MRLAMLTTRATVQGPLPKLIPLLADALRRLDCEVELLHCWGRRVEDEPLPAKLWGRAADVWSARRAVVLGEFPLVVVHTSHDWFTLMRDLALLSLLPRDVVRVLQFHGSQSPRLVAPGSSAFKRATSALLDRADAVLVLSREEQGEWHAFRPGSRVLVVRNPMPPLEASVSSSETRDGEPVILSVARLIESKGGADLIRALPLVRAEVPCRLVLVGAGPEENRLRALATELGVGNAVELPGYLEGDDLAEAYTRAAVFALPTSNEGFPTVILEAMAVGLPVVTTPIRGTVDHLQEGTNALYVPAGDEHRVAEALIRLLRDVDVRREMGAANREKVRDFEPDVVAREFLAALEEIMTESRRRRVSIRGAPRTGPDP